MAAVPQCALLVAKCEAGEKKSANNGFGEAAGESCRLASARLRRHLPAREMKLASEWRNVLFRHLLKYIFDEATRENNVICLWALYKSVSISHFLFYTVFLLSLTRNTSEAMKLSEGSGSWRNGTWLKYNAASVHLLYLISSLSALPF